jgi:hypothetical protein
MIAAVADTMLATVAESAVAASAMAASTMAAPVTLYRWHRRPQKAHENQSHQRRETEIGHKCDPSGRIGMGTEARKRPGNSLPCGA